MKRKMGDAIRSRRPSLQGRESILKAVAYNIPVWRSGFIFAAKQLSPLKSLLMRRLNHSVLRFLSLLYPFVGMLTIAERNVLIKKRFEEGETRTDIPTDFGISLQRVGQIVWRKEDDKARSRVKVMYQSI